MNGPRASKPSAVHPNHHIIRLPLYAMAVGAAMAALFIGATPGQANGEPAAVSIASCADVEVVFARGTFEGPGVGKVALPPDVAERITAVVLFGKPSPKILRLLHHDAPPVEIGPAFTGRTIDLCAPRDPICEPGGRDRGGHSAYAINGMVEEAADFVVARLRNR